MYDRESQDACREAFERWCREHEVVWAREDKLGRLGGVGLQVLDRMLRITSRYVRVSLSLL